MHDTSYFIANDCRDRSVRYKDEVTHSSEDDDEEEEEKAAAAADDSVMLANTEVLFCECWSQIER